MGSDDDDGDDDDDEDDNGDGKGVGVGVDAGVGVNTGVYMGVDVDMDVDMDMCVCVCVCVRGCGCGKGEIYIVGYCTHAVPMERRGRCSGVIIIRISPIGRYIIHSTWHTILIATQAAAVVVEVTIDCPSFLVLLFELLLLL